jgi:hypothetical protein
VKHGGSPRRTAISPNEKQFILANVRLTKAKINQSGLPSGDLPLVLIANGLPSKEAMLPVK